MAKSQAERKMERIAREERLRQTAQSIIAGYGYIGDFRVLDNEAEEVLKHILSQYNGNKDNHVGHRAETLPRHLQESLSLQYEKLKQCGLVTITANYPSGAILTLMESGKKYFENKEAALERQQKTEVLSRANQQEVSEKLQKVINNQDAQIIQFRQVIDNQNKQIATLESQIQILKNIFASGEDGVAVQKEIMKTLEKNLPADHPIRAYIADKGGDILVQGVISAISAYLATKGIVL